MSDFEDSGSTPGGSAYGSPSPDGEAPPAAPGHAYDSAPGGYDYGSAPGGPADAFGGPVPDGYPHSPADGSAPGGHAYGSAPNGPAHGYPQAPEGSAPGGYDYGATPGGPAHGYPQSDPQGHAQGYPPTGPAYDSAPGGYDYGYARSGDEGYDQGYASGAAPQQPAGASGGHGFAYEAYREGTAYVPEPLGGQLPSEAEPGAGYGVPAAGDAWGGHAPARDGYGTQPAVDGWAGAPASAHPWGASPEGAAAAASAPYAEPERETERTAEFPVVEEPQAPPRRTGSPIIPPGIQPAALTAALGLLMAGGAALGRPGLAVLLVALEAVTAAGWFRLNGMWPARQGIALAFLGGVTADVAVLAVSGDHGPVALLGTLGVWLLLVLVLQLRHHGSADERLSSLTATSASTLLTVVAAGYLATATSHAGTDPVVVGVLAVAAATLVRALRLPGGEPASLVASLAVATVTGLLTGPATGFGSGHGALLAAVCGACALIGLRVASYDFPSRFVHFTAGVALPLTAAAPAVYVLGIALT
jgi:hypothetical protein